jgi:hypothetical protein
MNLLDLARSALLPKPAQETPDGPSRRWRITSRMGPAMEVLFTPDATRVEVAALYPGATIEPLPDPPRRTATRTEADELRDLITLILANDTDAGRAEVLATACADPEAALMSFRLLAAECGVPKGEW